MRGSFVGAWIVVVAVGCAPQSEGVTQQPTKAAEAKAPEAATPEPASAADGLCSRGSEGWEPCDGKRVRIEGRAPQMVMQHPLLAGGPPGVETVHQSYLEVESGAQFIVLSEAKNTCEGAMVVTGTLGSIDLGGAPGTKDSYQGWKVADATIECR